MYEKFLTAKSVFFHKQTLALILIYFAIRILSFFLNKNFIMQSALVFIIIMVFGALYYKKQEWAWCILLGELLLGGAGHFFEFLDLSIRTALFITFISLWTITSIATVEKELYFFPRKLYFLLASLGIFVFISAVAGIYNGHGLRAVVSDLTPYSFFILIFPGYYFLSKKNGQEYLMRLFASFLLSSAVFSLFNFVIFSRGIAYLQSPYYKWFRDVAMGKITDMGEGFFRIVAPEHLLAVPVIIILASLLMREEKHHKMWWFMLIPASLILILNFSRIYFLAILIGFIILKYKHSFIRWFFINSAIVSLIFVLFAGINFIFSANHTFGLDLLTGRAKSISQPDTELSSLTRMSLLAPIFNMIKAHPLIGNGLGSRVVFNEPAAFNLVNTSHFDWGYLEIWAELGIFGFISFMSLILYIMYNLIQIIRRAADYHDFYVGALGGLSAFLIMNITSPVLFHSLGVFFIFFLIILISKPHTILDDIVFILYRTFHRLRN